MLVLALAAQGSPPGPDLGRAGAGRNPHPLMRHQQFFFPEGPHLPYLRPEILKRAIELHAANGRSLTLPSTSMKLKSSRHSVSNPSTSLFLASSAKHTPPAPPPWPGQSPSPYIIARDSSESQTGAVISTRSATAPAQFPPPPHRAPRERRVLPDDAAVAQVAQRLVDLHGRGIRAEEGREPAAGPAADGAVVRSRQVLQRGTIRRARLLRAAAQYLVMGNRSSVEEEICENLGAAYLFGQVFESVPEPPVAAPGARRDSRGIGRRSSQVVRGLLEKSLKATPCLEACCLQA
ncbi:uncharacterized protein PG998_015014 [Apiospora kogelbergensis]|uniref:uncharacterized protein n=1 Tax=Apiospora kogelbergensis TaxID=1337665 RepID=UPI003131711A